MHRKQEEEMAAQVAGMEAALGAARSKHEEDLADQAKAAKEVLSIALAPSPDRSILN